MPFTQRPSGAPRFRSHAPGVHKALFLGLPLGHLPLERRVDLAELKEEALKDNDIDIHFKFVSLIRALR